MYTVEELQSIFNVGFVKAERSCNTYLSTYGSNDSCGFAWVVIDGFNDRKLDGRMSLAKKIKKLDCVRKGRGEIVIWNPSKHQTQAISAKEAGARAFAEHLKEYGFNAYMDSRLD